jgi:hypothetical protein
VELFLVFFAIGQCECSKENVKAEVYMFVNACWEVLFIFSFNKYYDECEKYFYILSYLLFF